MKKVLVFFTGGILGIIVSFLLLYLTGLGLENWGIQLYSSESDQQRNFNIFVVVCLLMSLVSGTVAVKKFT